MKSINTNVNPENNKLFGGTDYTTSNADNVCWGSGDISFKGNLRIDGIFSGKINISGSLTVGENARITGEVEVSDLILFGYIVGKVRVINLAVFHPASVFSGTLTASEAMFYNGCKITGKREVGRISEVEAIVSKKINTHKHEVPVSEADELTHAKIKF